MYLGTGGNVIWSCCERTSGTANCRSSHSLPWRNATAAPTRAETFQHLLTVAQASSTISLPGCAWATEAQKHFGEGKVVTGKSSCACKLQENTKVQWKARHLCATAGPVYRIQTVRCSVSMHSCARALDSQYSTACLRIHNVRSWYTSIRFPGHSRLSDNVYMQASRAWDEGGLQLRLG